MKNYDIKNAVEELTNKEVKTNGNRVAFLVPNMFNRVEGGYLKHRPVTTIEIPVVEETPVQEASAPVVENVQPVQQEVVQPVQEVSTEKPYILKVDANDMEKFKDPTKTDNNPKRLLISTAFKNKLVANRAAKMVKTVVETVSNTIDDAVNRYHELIDKRTELIQEVKNIEQELTRLVKENNLTQEQVSRGRVM